MCIRDRCIAALDVVVDSALENLEVGEAQYDAKTIHTMVIAAILVAPVMLLIGYLSVNSAMRPGLNDSNPIDTSGLVFGFRYYKRSPAGGATKVRHKFNGGGHWLRSKIPGQKTKEDIKGLIK